MYGERCRGGVDEEGEVEKITKPDQKRRCDSDSHPTLREPERSEEAGRAAALVRSPGFLARQTLSSCLSAPSPSCRGISSALQVPFKCPSQAICIAPARKPKFQPQRCELPPIQIRLQARRLPPGRDPISPARPRRQRARAGTVARRYNFIVRISLDSQTLSPQAASRC
ncbi:hypothetical protein L1887_48585 [Cichorium endivia]|nr:hypothetical protein L1887_48585 [Cichorium endivia]